MKALLVAFVVALLGGATATGQVTTPPQRSFGVARMEGMQATGTNVTGLAGQPALVNSCPVSMRAQQLSDGSLVKTRDIHPSGMGQWLHLSLESRDARRIAKATLRVRGFSPKARVTQTRLGGSQDFDLTRTLTVQFVTAANRSVLADLWVPGMTAVGRIEILSLEFSDGTNWKTDGPSSCRVVPDPEMLVNGR